jgi:hypothetical protein
LPWRDRKPIVDPCRLRRRRALERGVFRRPTREPVPLDWQACLLSLQQITNYQVQAGGITALSLQGYSHCLPLGKPPPAWLYGSAIPSWLARLTLDAPVTTPSVSLFNDPGLGLAESKSGSGNALPWGWALRLSSPERAFLEALDELPVHESFHNLDMVFEGLATLSPRRLAALLQRRQNPSALPHHGPAGVRRNNNRRCRWPVKPMPHAV